MRRFRLAIFGIAALISLTAVQSVSAQEIRIPGLVTYLYHNLNTKRGALGVRGQYFNLRGWNGQSVIDVRYPELPPPGYVVYSGGDLGAPSGCGFKWFAVADAGYQDPGQYRALPPGLVIALMHSTNQAHSGIRAFGSYDPPSGPQWLSGFIKRSGGDIGAPSGVGFFWYESIGAGNTDWSLIDRLPAGTVVGLRHTQNRFLQFNEFIWQGKYTCRSRDVRVGNPPVACNSTKALPHHSLFDSVLGILPPPGFVVMDGGDRGAPSGQGFTWFQKY
jgi:hypothetical protein